MMEAGEAECVSTRQATGVGLPFCRVGLGADFTARSSWAGLGGRPSPGSGSRVALCVRPCGDEQADFRDNYSCYGDRVQNHAIPSTQSRTRISSDSRHSRLRTRDRTTVHCCIRVPRSSSSATPISEERWPGEDVLRSSRGARIQDQSLKLNG